MKFENLSDELKERLSKLKEDLQYELLSIAKNEKELEVSLTLVEAVMDKVESLNDLTKEYRGIKHIRKRAEFIQENFKGSCLGVLNTDNLIKYQDYYLTENIDKDGYFVNPLPLILASLDKELVIFQDPEAFVNKHKCEINHFIGKSLKRIETKKPQSKAITYTELRDKLYNENMEHVPFKLYPKIKKIYKGYIDKFDVTELLVEFNQKQSDKFWETHKEAYLKFNPNLKKFTYKSMVEEYFKGFKLAEGLYTPKLSKQLSKQGFKPTNKELQYFGEVKDYFNDYYSRGFDRNGTNIENTTLFLVDTKDFKIPTLVDPWAFAGSCHKYEGAGQDSHFAMDYLGFNFLKVYSAGYTKHSKKPILRNLYRSYFYTNEAGDIAHAGAYSNIATEKNKTAYEFTTVLYCLLFDKKIDDFKEIEGAYIPEGRFYNREGDRFMRLWCNMSRENSYTTIGTDDILSSVHFKKDDVDSSKNYRDIISELDEETLNKLQTKYYEVIK